MLALGAGSPVFARIANDREVLRGRGEEFAKTTYIAHERLRASACGAHWIRRDDPRRASEAGLEHARKIALAEEARAEHTAPMPLREVVAENPMPDERVEVKVDDVGGCMQLGRLA